MIQKRVVKAVTVLIIASLLIVGSCSKKSSGPAKLSYSSDLNELRNHFNRDKSKVRLLLILSPT